MQPYSFTATDVQETLSDLIEELITAKVPSIKPAAILCGGQPGAGKSTIHDIQRTRTPDVIIINGDAFRQLHPNFEKIQSQYGDDSVIHTQPFVNAMVEGLIEQLSSRKYSMVIEGTLRDPNVPLKTCKLLKSKGYDVEMHVMAVSKEQSWKGTIDRYNEMKRNGQTARATPKDKHDAVVETLPGNISTLYKSKQFARIALYTRAGECIYDSTKTPNIDPKETLRNVLHATVAPMQKPQPPRQETFADKMSRMKSKATSQTDARAAERVAGTKKNTKRQNEEL